MMYDKSTTLKRLQVLHHDDCYKSDTVYNPRIHTMWKPVCYNDDSRFKLCERLEVGVNDVRQINNSKETPSNYTITTVINQTLFITSVFTRCGNRFVTMTIVDSSYGKDSKYACCLREDNGTFLVANKSQIMPFVTQGKLPGFQLLFELPRKPPDNFGATVIKLTDGTVTCPGDAKVYVRPSVPLIPRTFNNLSEAYRETIDQNCIPERERTVKKGNNEPFSMAVCAKLAFNDLDPYLVIEWVEYYKKMGVSMIVMYTFNLNNTTRRVLEYYEDAGYLTVYSFDIPLKEKVHRQPGDESGQSWSDEQHALNDCFERLRLFKYIFIGDFDEFLNPVKDADVSSLLDRLRSTFPVASAFTFFPQFHFTDDNKEKNSTHNVSRYNASNSLYVDRFLEHTDTIRCVKKNVVIPGRLNFWAPHTHGIRRLKPYTVAQVNPSIANIGHYRKYQKKWDENIDPCIVKYRHQLSKRLRDGKHLRFFDDQLRNTIMKKKKLLLH